MWSRHKGSPTVADRHKLKYIKKERSRKSQGKVGKRQSRAGAAERTFWQISTPFRCGSFKGRISSLFIFIFIFLFLIFSVLFLFPILILLGMIWSSFALNILQWHNHLLNGFLLYLSLSLSLSLSVKSIGSIGGPFQHLTISNIIFL